MFTILELAWNTIRRNALLSLGSFSIVFLVSSLLFLMNGFGAVVERSIQSLENTIDMTLFLKNTVSLDNTGVSNVVRDLEREGYTVTKLSSKDALDRLKQSSAVPDIIDDTATFVETYKKESALLPILVVKGVEKVGTDKFKAIIENPVHASLFDSSYIDEQISRASSFSVVTSMSKYIYVGFYILFLAVAALIIFNTTRIFIFSRKEEIEIMQLVGARRNVIEYPFYVEMSMIALLAVGISFVIIFLLVYQLDAIFSFSGGAAGATKLASTFVHSMLTFFAGNSLFELLRMGAIFVLITLMSVWFALRSYLPRI